VLRFDVKPVILGSAERRRKGSTMTIEVQIVDQRVRKVAEDRREIFSELLGIKNDPPKLHSAAFVFVVIKTLLDLDETEALDCMVEGSNDFNVDAIHVGAPFGPEFLVTLVQGKYKRRRDGASAFPERGVVGMLAALRSLFDPEKEVNGNIRLTERLIHIRQLLAQGYIPRVAIVLCNNGSRWTTLAQRRIEQDPSGKKVTWRHVGPDELIKLMRPAVQIDTTLQLSGFAIVESFQLSKSPNRSGFCKPTLCFV
jgi:hypothetical protein